MEQGRIYGEGHKWKVFVWLSGMDSDGVESFGVCRFRLAYRLKSGADVSISSPCSTIDNLSYPWVGVIIYSSTGNSTST